MRDDAQDAVLRQDRRMQEAAELRLAAQHVLRLRAQPREQRIALGEVDDFRALFARFGAHPPLLGQAII